MSQKEIGKFIAVCRKARNLKQHELAERLGITNKAVSKWETGQGMPDIGTLPALAEALGVSVDELLSGKYNEEKAEHQKPETPPCFTAAIQIDKARMRRQCKAAWQALDVLPKVVLMIDIVLLIAASAAMLALWWKWGQAGAMWAVAAALVCAIPCCLFGWLWRAHRSLKRFRRENGDERGLSILFYNDGFEAANHAAKSECTYEDIAAMLEVDGAVLLRCRSADYLLEPADLAGGNWEEFTTFLKARAISAKNIEYTTKRQCQLLAALLLAAVGCGFAVMQLGYLAVGRAFRFEYLYDNWFYLANAIMLVFFLGACLLVFYRHKRAVIILCASAALLFCANLYLAAFPKTPLQTTIVSTSPSGITCVLKLDTTGTATFCRQEFLWFVRPKTALSHPVAGQAVKLQWLAEDVCAITYLSPHSDAPQVYVATYGDRGRSGRSYYEVSGVLGTANWHPARQGQGEWEFGKTEDGFYIANFEGETVYPREDCMQFGTTAMVMYKDGRAEWVVALDTDCVEDGGVLQGSGTIQLCPVAMGETAAIPFTGYARSYAEDG